MANSVQTYLNFNGNCEEAFNFYKSVFETDFTFISHFSKMPPSDEYPLSEEDMDKVMHVSLPIGNSVLMGSDVGSAMSAHFKHGNNFSISITADNKDETNKLFEALSEGGQVTMPPADTFWGDYFGMCTDKFGVNWMISTNEQGQS